VLAPNKGPGVMRETKSTAILPKLDDTVFRQRLSNIMTDNKYDRKLKGRSRGRLDMTRLSKVPTGSTSIFTQKQSRQNKLYNVVLVVDQSGSMNHSDAYEDEFGNWREGKRRIVHAADVATFIAKSAMGLNVNLAILGFNHYQYVYKHFDKPVLDYTKLHNGLVSRIDEGGGCNHDYDAIGRAYKMLKGRQGKNIVLFISDGQPATCGHVDRFIQDPQMYLRDRGSELIAYTNGRGERLEMFIDLESSKQGAEWRNKRSSLNHLVRTHEQLATTIGIGIQTTCWQCPENVTVDDIDDMKPKVIDILQRKIKRG
jgi:hypothetical protein